MKEVKMIFPIKTNEIRGVARRKARNLAKRYWLSRLLIKYQTDNSTIILMIT
jgi:hypothetical protein